MGSRGTLKLLNYHTISVDNYIVVLYYIIMTVHATAALHG